MPADAVPRDQRGLDDEQDQPGREHHAVDVEENAEGLPMYLRDPSQEVRRREAGERRQEKRDRHADEIGDDHGRRQVDPGQDFVDLAKTSPAKIDRRPGTIAAQMAFQRSVRLQAVDIVIDA